MDKFSLAGRAAFQDWAGLLYPIEWAGAGLPEPQVSNFHTTAFQVRDYECDLQGVVNNAVYMNYLEHARHDFLKSRGLDFAEITRQGIRLVIVKAELTFQSSLTSGDEFEIHTRYSQESRLRFVFHQDIVRIHDGRKMLAATMTATAVNARGRPFEPREILSRLL